MIKNRDIKAWKITIKEGAVDLWQRELSKYIFWVDC